MKKKRFKWIDIIITCLITAVAMIFLFAQTFPNEITDNFDKGYKQGQIDALNGIQNWDKVATKDTIYIKIK